MENLESLKTELLGAIHAAASLAELEDARVAALGKKGVLTEKMKGLGALPPDARREAGQAFNEVKQALTEALESRQADLAAAALEARLAAETADITLPARPHGRGHIHPISRTIEEMTAIFADLGFTVAEGPDIEDDWHNFTALNIPEDHPARQMHDTFYLPETPGSNAKRLLRTHTSPVQIRTMRRRQPPIRIVAPGRTFRSDYDMTHTPMFHQIEALVIDEGTHMGHLKGCIESFLRVYFDMPELPVRFRPSYFPFTEPSAEVDIGCHREGGELKIGGGEGWMEIMGCGMVHPKVLAACDIDPGKYQGFAFGMGVERVAMLKYGIPDLRTFFEADLRWLRHYGFSTVLQPNMAYGI